MSVYRRLTMVCVVVLGLWFGVSPCAAQDLEIFQDDDLVDPALLQVDGKELLFVASRAYAGVDTDYSRRNDVFGLGVKFVRVVNNVYYRKFQGHVSYARFAVNPSDLRETYVIGRALPFGTNTQGVPLERIGVEASRYFGGDGVFARVKLQWNKEQMMSGHRQQEYGVTVDTKIAGDFLSEGPGGFSMLAGVQYVSRPTIRQHYLGFSLRQTVEAEHFALSFAEGYGFERTSSDWQDGAGRVQVAVIVPVKPFSTKLHFTVSSLQVQTPQVTSNQVKESNVEAAVFVSLPLFSHLF